MKDIEALWQAYLEARTKAEESQLIADGIAAGRAWGAFIRAFEHDQPLPVVGGARG